MFDATSLLFPSFILFQIGCFLNWIQSVSPSFISPSFMIMVSSSFTYFLIKTAFLCITFGNWKRCNKETVNGITFFGNRYNCHLFHLFHPREWNSWKSRNSCNSGDRFGWTLDFYSGIQWFLFHLNWNRWSLEYLFQVFIFLKSLERNAT